MNVALVLAGGTGTRLGSDIPKQYIEVNGKPVIGYCLDTFERMNEVGAVWIVATPQWRDVITSCGCKKLRGFSEPGENRQLSIWNGLQDIAAFAGAEDVVIIHDAARPLVSKKLLSDCIEACKEHDGALPVLPMKDTVYLGENGRITSLLEREKIYAGQAPEAFRFGGYYEATKALLPDRILKINGSTEPAILAGMDIALVDGEENNFKVTTKADLEKLRAILQ